MKKLQVSKWSWFRILLTGGGIGTVFFALSLLIYSFEKEKQGDPDLTQSSREAEFSRRLASENDPEGTTQDYRDWFGNADKEYSGGDLSDARLKLIARMSRDLGLSASVNFVIEEFGNKSEEAGEMLDFLLWEWQDKNEAFVTVFEDPRLEGARNRLAKKVFGAGGLFEGLGMSAKTFSSFSELSGPSQNLYGFLLAKELSLEDRQEAKLDETVVILNDSKYGEDLVDGFFRQLARRDPNLAWEHAIKLTESGSKLSQETLNNLAGKLAQSGFEDALDQLATSAETMGLEPLGVAFIEWVDSDVTKATEWFAANKDQFKGTELDTFSVALAQSAETRDEFDTAWEWIDQVSDPVLKEEISGKVWWKERKVVQSEAQADPKGTMRDLISGDSVHPEFWIKEAFSQWTIANSEEATQWYEENRESLAPEQNQHIARVYAEAAITSGDLENARQWAAQVPDEKFQKKLREQIEKVEKE